MASQPISRHHRSARAHHSRSTIVPDPGSHWLHPHTGRQLDRGLYAPFTVEDPAEPGGYDAEWVLVLDD